MLHKIQEAARLNEFLDWFLIVSLIGVSLSCFGFGVIVTLTLVR